MMRTVIYAWLAAFGAIVACFLLGHYFRISMSDYLVSLFFGLAMGTTVYKLGQFLGDHLGIYLCKKISKEFPDCELDTDTAISNSCPYITTTNSFFSEYWVHGYDD